MHGKNVVGDKFNRNRQHRGIVGKTDHRQHVGNCIERQNEIGDCRDQYRFTFDGVARSKAQ